MRGWGDSKCGRRMVMEDGEGIKEGGGTEEEGEEGSSPSLSLPLPPSPSLPLPPSISLPPLLLSPSLSLHLPPSPPSQTGNERGKGEHINVLATAIKMFMYMHIG